MQSPFKESLSSPSLPVWKDASLLQETIASYIANSFINNEHFVGPRGELVSFEAKRRYKQKEDVLKGADNLLDMCE